MTVAIILALLFALLLIGVPVAFALGSLGLGMLWFGGFSPLMAPQAVLSTLDGFILLAVPLFLLMSNVLLKGGVGRDLFAAVQAWVGHWPVGWPWPPSFPVGYSRPFPEAPSPQRPQSAPLPHPR